MDKITAMDQIASTREAFIAGLMDVAPDDPKICLVSADSLKAARATPFVEKYPERCFEVGICEQNAVCLRRRPGLDRTETLLQHLRRLHHHARLRAGPVVRGLPAPQREIRGAQWRHVRRRTRRRHPHGLRGIRHPALDRRHGNRGAGRRRPGAQGHARPRPTRRAGLHAPRQRTRTGHLRRLDGRSSSARPACSANTAPTRPSSPSGRF